MPSGGTRSSSGFGLDAVGVPLEAPGWSEEALKISYLPLLRAAKNPLTSAVVPTAVQAGGTPAVVAFAPASVVVDPRLAPGSARPPWLPLSQPGTTSSKASPTRIRCIPTLPL